MQHSRLLAKMSSRSVLCGALFGLAFMPVANAQRNQAGPADATSLAYSSSSSLPDDPGADAGAQAPTLGGPTQTQPQTPTYGGGQRRYGHQQTYSDRWTNADGSSKYALSFGGGMTIPLSPKTTSKTPGVTSGSCVQNNSQLGAQGQYFNSGGSPCIPNNILVQTPDWAIQLGLGRNFNKRFGVLGQFEFDRMNVPASIINYIINTNAGSASGTTTTGLAGLDLNTHVISLTLNPLFNFYQSDTWGAYVIGGGGYYHKVTNFTLTVSGGYGGYGYGGGYASAQNIATVSGNAGGMDLGFGVTRKFSRYSKAKLFLEARYNYIASLSNANSAYPENSHSTGYIPVVLGVRW